MFESLDIIYVPAEDVDVSARRYVEDLGAELVWKVRGMGTVVACLRVSRDGPSILLSGHLEGPAPILVAYTHSAINEGYRAIQDLPA